jgi:hypothetical protein
MVSNLPANLLSADRMGVYAAMNQTTGSETPSGTTPNVREQITVAGNQAVDTVRRLISEGNVRSVVVRQGGRTIVSFPVTIGVLGTVLAPQLALLGIIAAVLTQCTIEVVREGGPNLPTV